MQIKVLSGPQVCLNRNDDAEVYVVAFVVGMGKIMGVRIDDFKTVPNVGDTVEVASVGRSYLPR